MSEAYNDKAYWYSKLEDFRFCPAYYKAKHIDKLPLEGKSLDTEFGTALHLGVNEILSGGNGIEIFNMFWDSVDEKPLKRFKFDKKSLKNNGEIMLSRFERLHAKHFKPFKMEERIFTEMEGKLIEGTPDFLGDYKDIPSIVDFKTSSSRYEAKKILCEEQLSGYAAMAVKALGYTPMQRVYVVFIKDFKEPSIQIVKAELTSTITYNTISNMLATVNDIEATRHFRKNPSQCIRGPIVCPAFEHCWGKKEIKE